MMKLESWVGDVFTYLTRLHFSQTVDPCVSTAYN